MALFLDIGEDDLLQIGDAFVALERKSGKRARLKITGKSEVTLRKGALRAAPAVPATDLADVEVGASAPRTRAKG